MIFNVKKNPIIGWYVANNISNNDRNIATLLEISYEEYVTLLIKYGAFEYLNKGYYFNTLEEVKQFLNSNELLPLITMAILTE